MTLFSNNWWAIWLQEVVPTIRIQITKSLDPVDAPKWILIAPQN
jgi:hypothetical protein